MQSGKIADMSSTGPDLSPILALERNRDRLEELRDALVTPGRVLLFAGAGMSQALGFPGWSGFLMDLARRYAVEAEIRTVLDSNLYEEAASRLEESLGEAGFLSEMKYTFGDHNLNAVQWDQQWVHLLPMLTGGPIITTNFDRVIEKVFQFADKPLDTVVLGGDQEKATRALQGGSRMLLKLHGDWEFRSQRVLTVQEYEVNYGAGDIDWMRALPRLLRRLFENRIILFIGCSLNNDRTMLALQAAWRDAAAMHFAIVEMPGDPRGREARRSFLGDRGILPIWYPAGEHQWIGAMVRFLMPPISAPEPQFVARTGYVGRERETADVIERLRNAEAGRVVNVWGPPGIGKTEVCKAVLRQLSGQSSGSVFVVSIAGAQTEQALLARLADAVGRSDLAGRDPILMAYRRRGGLVYLDNLEDALADASVPDLLRSLASPPNIKVLASSREQLPFGVNYPIDRLRLDAAVRLFRQEWENSSGEPLEDLPRTSAFVDRKLDRHPLSIVLAAAQVVPGKSVAELEAEWDREALQLAQAAGYTSLDISLSRSLKAVNAKNLDAWTLWLAMAWFPDGMTQAAFNRIFGESGTSEDDKRLVADATDVLRLYERLRLLRRDNSRFYMLAPLRQFMSEKALRPDASMDVERVVDRVYFSHFNLLAHRVKNPPLFSTDYQSAADEMLMEFRNYGQFVGFAARVGKAWYLTMMSGMIQDLYQLRPLLGIDINEQIRSAQQKQGLNEQAANTTVQIAYLWTLLWQFEPARREYACAMEVFVSEKNQQGLADAALGLANLQSQFAQAREAEENYAAAIERYREVGDELGLGNALNGLASLLARDPNRAKEARSGFEQAAELFIKTGSRIGLGNVNAGMAAILARDGQFDVARNCYSVAIGHYTDARDNNGVAYAHDGLADLCRQQGDLDEARRHYEQARQIFLDAQYKPGLAQMLANLAEIAWETGGTSEARRLIEECENLARETGAAPIIDHIETVKARVGV